MQAADGLGRRRVPRAPDSPPGPSPRPRALTDPAPPVSAAALPPAPPSAAISPPNWPPRAGARPPSLPPAPPSDPPRPPPLSFSSSVFYFLFSDGDVATAAGSFSCLRHRLRRVASALDPRADPECEGAQRLTRPRCAAPVIKARVAGPGWPPSLLRSLSSEKITTITKSRVGGGGGEGDERKRGGCRGRGDEGAEEEAVLNFFPPRRADDGSRPL